MKKVIICLFFLFSIVTYSQDNFRVDYSQISIYDSETEKWTDWQDGYNTFVINYNENGDIAHCKANGDKVVYSRISKKIEEGYTTKENEYYQIINALDEDGVTFSFQFFDNRKIGLKLIYSNIMIQFSEK